MIFIKTVPEILDFVENQWPSIRETLLLPPRCPQCILLLKEDEALCPICLEYNQNLCTSIRSRPPKGFDIKTIIEANEDAFRVFLSGGKDSAVMLDHLRQTFPNADIDAMVVNTGFLSSVAIPNAIRIAEQTRTNLHIDNVHIDKFKERLRQAFLAGKKAYEVDFVEGSLIYEIGCERAKTDNRLVINGMSPSQLDHINTGDVSELGFFFEWWPMSDWEIKSKAQNLLGSVSVHPLLTNSLLLPLTFILDIRRHGQVDFEFEFAQDVREGKTERKVWLHLFEALNYLVQAGSLDKFLEQGLHNLDLTLEDL